MKVPIGIKFLRHCLKEIAVHILFFPTMLLFPILFPLVVLYDYYCKFEEEERRKNEST